MKMDISQEQAKKKAEILPDGEGEPRNRSPGQYRRSFGG